MKSGAKLIDCFIILFLLCSSIGFVQSNPQTNTIEDFTFSEVLHLPIDPSLPTSSHQPIDLPITFKNPCWAQNEQSHAVRVFLDKGSECIEIESQLYDIIFENDCQISSCNLVFIIPENVKKNDQFLLVYDDNDISKTAYPDHVTVSDLHHYYEPISGQSMDFDYYQINQDENVIYGILQKGILLGNGISHTVVKCKEHTKTFEMVHTDQVATFYISHHTAGSQHNNIGWTGTGWADDVTTSILVDGNLMVKVRITSISPENTLKTDNIYTYYFCPSETKRLYVDANHDVLKNVQVTGAMQRDGTYASLSTFKSRIAAIEKMNIGKILPSLHVYNEDETIKEYSIPSDPTSPTEEWILSTTDDCDLGSNAWVCLDDKNTGKAHGIIFNSNTGFIRGVEDGLQVKTAVKQHVKLPGLEADTGDVYITRNSYERGGTHNTQLDSSMNISFQAEFVTFETGGYQSVQNESEVYQTLIPTHPSKTNSVSTKDNKEDPRFDLTVFVHQAPSFPFGSLLSATLGKSFSFISVELFEQNRLASSGSAGRLPMGSIPGFPVDSTLIQKAKQVIPIIEFKNSSFFKKITFPTLNQGIYVVKVYKENSLVGRNKKFIGFEIVEVTEDTKTHIHCGKETEIQIQSIDQHENTLTNVQALILKDNQIISEGFTDENGSLSLHLPYTPLSSFTLKTRYQGFHLNDEPLKTRLPHVFIPIKKTIQLPIHHLTVTIVDTLGLTPTVDLSPTLTSTHQIETRMIQPEKQNNGHFVFSNVYAEDYRLQLSYKSFVTETQVPLDKNTDLHLVFPAEFNTSLEVLNQCGLPLNQGTIQLTRNNEIKQKIIQAKTTTLSIPPGTYDLSISSSNNDLYHQIINVYSDKTIVAVTTHESIIHQLFIYLGISLSLFSILYMILKKKVLSGLKILALSLLIIALFSPWWALSGSENNLSHSTTNYIYPSIMITHTTTETYTFGENGVIPTEITLIFDSIAILLILTSLTLTASLYLDHIKHKKRNLLFHSSIVLLLLVIILYLITIYQVTSLGVGSFIGSGSLDIQVPHSTSTIALQCFWGPGIGLILCCIASIILIVTRLTQQYMK